MPLYLGSEHHPSRLDQTPHRMQRCEEPGVHQDNQVDDKPRWLRSLSSDHRKLYPTARCGKFLRGRSYQVLRPLNGWVRPLYGNNPVHSYDIQANTCSHMSQLCSHTEYLNGMNMIPFDTRPHLNNTNHSLEIHVHTHSRTSRLY